MGHSYSHFRLNVGMLNQLGFVLPLQDDIRAGKPFFHFALLQHMVGGDVAGRVGME